jgi:phosphoserine phosphatase RsbU/P
MTATATPPRPQVTPPPIPPRNPNLIERAQSFWNRVTEGLALQQLWKQFVTETRTGYRLYSREVQARAPQQTLQPGRQKWLHTMADYFWAILMKLSPAKRVVLLVGLVMLLMGSLQFTSGNTQTSLDMRSLGGLLILLLLILETGDRVTMKRDLEIAREIQHWLVPSEPPVVPGLDIAFVTRPANTVAGDYYDVVPRGVAGKYLLVIADVAGKSMPAALLMATFQASLKTLSVTTESLVELVGGVNRYACDHSIRGSRFTTAFLAEYDPCSRKLTYVNCGHNPPILLRGVDIAYLSEGGVPLGILPDAAYECAEITLAPGDLLAIYTDGVVEAENARGEEFGEERFITALRWQSASSAKNMIEQVMISVDAFVQTAPQHDDITCMVVRSIVN